MNARTLRIAAAALVAAGSLFAVQALAADPAPAPLIPRDVLFGNPERVSPQISPDGKKLAWIAPDEKDVLQVWVKTMGKEDGKKVTADKKRGIRQYMWAQDDRTLLYMQDSDGDENFHVFGVDLVSGNVRDFTPFQGVRAGIDNVSPVVRDRILVSMNLRDRRLFDVYEVSLVDGGVKLVAENPGDVAGWDATDDLVVKVAQAQTPDGGTAIRFRESATSPWKTVLTAPLGESVNSLDIVDGGKALLLSSSLGSNTARVVKKDLATGTETVIAENPSVDVGGILLHPTKHFVQAVDFPAGRQAWTVVDQTILPDFEAIAKLRDGDFTVVNRDRDDKTWLVAFNEDRGPARYYSWDRETQKGTFLFVARPKLEGLPLSPMRAVSFPARDGLTLNGYLTLPVGVKPSNLPLVLFVHGGPWARDSWGYDGGAQWLANRGYAVLQLNYRGSTGYGKKFKNAAMKQFAAKMHDDLLDGVEWVVKQGWVDPRKVAILGGSYGGYATLVGLTFTPETFACGVDIVGPSNLATLIESFPAYWAPFLASTWYPFVGDPKVPAEKADMEGRSPMFKVGNITKPLLIGQGANDPRVTQKESEQIVAAMEAKGLPVTYVVYSDEGHGFARPENRIDFFARSEAFLAACLGGRVEPLPEGGKVKGSTATVKVVEAKKK
ncbi:MAG: S9 family peptidase [Deltaproteobacteria bacterium]